MKNRSIKRRPFAARLTTAARRRRRTRPQTSEVLEDRALLATFTVPNLTEASLREAVEAANSRSGEDTVRFADGLSGTINLTSELRITDSVILEGNENRSIHLSGQSRGHRVLHVHDGTDTKLDVEIRGITIEKGGDGTVRLFGSGILNRENLTLDNVWIQQNDGALSGIGGGLYHSDGTLTVSNSKFRQNTAGTGGGIYVASGSGNIDLSEIENNSATNGGGYYQADGSFNIGSTIASNQAAFSGGGIFLDGGSLWLDRSSIVGNTATDGGGVSAMNGTFRIEFSSIVANHARQFGGGIWSSTQIDGLFAEIVNNSATAVAGLYHTDTTSLARFVQSEFSTNVATTQSGGISAEDAPIELYESTLNKNSVDSSSRQAGTQFRIRNSSANLTNVTINDTGAGSNSSSSIFNLADAGRNSRLDIINSTVVGKPDLTALETNASSDGFASTWYSNSIFTGFGTSLVVGTATGSRSGSLGHNLFSDTPPENLTHESDLTGTDPQLGELTTLTAAQPVFPLNLGSPAIDAGNNENAIDLRDPSGNKALATDGRSFMRFFDGDRDGVSHVDIGAFEFVGSTLIVDEIGDVRDNNLNAGNLSLREAVDLSNNEQTRQTIRFAPTLIGSTIKLTGSSLTFFDDVSIIGPGATKLTIDAEQKSRVLDFYPRVHADVFGLSITGGSANESSSPDPEIIGFGGGVLVRDNSSLRLIETYLHDNTGLAGAAVANYKGSLQIDRSTVSNNGSSNDVVAIANWGGVDNASLSLIKTTVSGNTVVTDLANFGGDVHIQQSTIVSDRLSGDNDGGNVFAANSILGKWSGNALDESSNHNFMEDPARTGGLQHGVNDNIVGDGLGNALAWPDVVDVLKTTVLRPEHRPLPGGAVVGKGSLGRDIGATQNRLLAVDDSATTTAASTVEINVLDNDRPVGPPQVRRFSQPLNGEVSLSPIGTVLYTPNPGFTGEDSFSYEVTETDFEHADFSETAEEGSAVAIDGSFAVVGARRDDTVATNAGAALIYVRDATSNWRPMQTLIPNDLEARDRFGYSVAISGTTIVVGARLKGDLGFKSGAAYVYEFDQSANAFVQTQKLLDVDGGARGQFGHSVAIDGDTIAVGIRRDRGTKGAASGAVAIFERGLTGWVQSRRWEAADGAKGDQFGSSIALNGDTLVVGAWRDNENDIVDSGSAYVFERNEGGTDNWGQVKKLVPSTSRDFDWFGHAVDIDGDHIVVGKPIRNERTRIGEAFVFERNQGGANNWGEKTTLVSPNSAEKDQYGFSVRINANTIAVGARLDSTVSASAGAVYLFQRNETTGDWDHTETHTGRKREQFGFAMDIDQESIFVGANQSNTNGENSGRVHVRHRTTDSAVVTVQVNQNQRSDSGIGDNDRPDISVDDLAPIVDAAIEYWQSTPLSSSQMDALNRSVFKVSSLTGDLLGTHSAGRITIDADAAGHGWYVDQTPLDLTDDDISDQMDLLSTIIHELGHSIGLEDTYDDEARNSVMFGRLGTGERRLPSASELDGIFSSLRTDMGIDLF
ncbi:MAG: Ig-like domain-containing protein [Planctomycetaceae bacterium]